MATPRKGAIIREFSSADLSRINGTSVVVEPKASPAEQSQVFDPPRQFFPAGKPLAPVAPAGTTEGRAWDFPSFLNLNYVPRTEGGEGVPAAVLRQLAAPDQGGLDLLRLAIETRKDQMAAQTWALRDRANRHVLEGPTLTRARALLKFPDGVNRFRGWMRSILEDHFVIDLVAIYYGATGTMAGGGRRPLAEVMAGDTIKRYILSDDGRTPQPPLPAYAQILKGMPATDYTTDELGCYIYNPLPNRLYGMSRVAQILVTINTALNRALYQLEYFTAGTTPDGFMELPKEWNLRRIQQWTEWFNSELEGVASERRKIRFVPQGANFTQTKEAILKDMFDEWMARIICYCFSLPPQALVKETNRATADTSAEVAQEEGLEPTKLWFKDVVDDLLERWGMPEIELYWKDEEIVDPEMKARVVVAYHGGDSGQAKPIITLAEAREMGGFAPASPEQIAELTAPPPSSTPLPVLGGSVPVPDGGDAPADQDDGKVPEPDASTKLAKASRSGGGRSLPLLDFRSREIDRAERAIRDELAALLRQQRMALAAAAVGAVATKFRKRSGDDLLTAADLRSLVAAVEREPWSQSRRQALEDALSAAARNASTLAYQAAMAASGDPAVAEALTQANEAAIAWARARVGNLITEVSDTTRDVVNRLTASAIESGLTNDEFAQQLSDAYGFSDERASMIARTETQFAANHGSLAGYRASGVVDGKQWVGEDPCDDCLENIDAGAIGLDATFPTGDDAPPAHPNCKCSVIAVIQDEGGE